MFGGGGDPFRNMHTQMNNMRMMDNMMNAMMNDAFTMLDGFGPGHGHHPMLTNGGNGRQRSPHNDMMMSPFGGFGGGMFAPPPLFGMMGQMQNLQHRAMNDPNSVVISQSTMMSFDGNGPPKVVQESTRKAGNVKESRKVVQAGDEAHLTVGHAIGDRAHVIEKKRDKAGRTRQSQKFVNLEEEHAEAFNNEFKSQARDFFSGGGLFKKDNGRAIEGNRNGRSGKQAGKSGVGSYGHGESSTPIVTVPDDDEDVGRGRRGGQARSTTRTGDDDVVFVGNNRNGGPIIREISDDEADRHEDRKRRKGVFGKFLG